MLKILKISCRSNALRLPCARIASNVIPKMAAVAQSRDKDIRDRHKSLEGIFASDEEKVEVMKKRMVYRSKQRGWLEVDLLLGSWAAKHVASLNKDEMREYELILEEETINIFNYISGKDPLPPHLEGLSIIQRIQDYAFGLGLTTPAKYADLKGKANLT